MDSGQVQFRVRSKEKGWIVQNSGISVNSQKFEAYTYYKYAVLSTKLHSKNCDVYINRNATRKKTKLNKFTT